MWFLFQHSVNFINFYLLKSKSFRTFALRVYKINNYSNLKDVLISMKKKQYLEPSMEKVKLNHVRLLIGSEEEPEFKISLEYGGEGDELDIPQ